MVGEQLAVLRRHGGYHCLDGLVQLLDAGLEGGVVGGVVFCVAGVAGGKVVADDFGVTQGQNGVGPQVRVGVSGFFREGKVELPLFGADGLVAQADDGGAGLGVGPRHFQGWLFQEQPVQEYQVGVGQSRGHGGGGGKGMGVDPFRHDSGQRDAVAADVFHDAGYGGHRGGYLQKPLVVPTGSGLCLRRPAGGSGFPAGAGGCQEQRRRETGQQRRRLAKIPGNDAKSFPHARVAC